MRDSRGVGGVELLKETFVIDLKSNPKVTNWLFRLTDRLAGRFNDQRGRQTRGRRKRKRRGTVHSLPAIPADIMCTWVESGSRTPFSFSLAAE